MNNFYPLVAWLPVRMQGGIVHCDPVALEHQPCGQLLCKLLKTAVMVGNSPATQDGHVHAPKNRPFKGDLGALL